MPNGELNTPLGIFPGILKEEIGRPFKGKPMGEDREALFGVHDLARVIKPTSLWFR